jgi:hypothetical protein
VLVLSPGESLESEFDRRDGSVLDLVPLLGVSRLQTRFGGLRLFSSGAHRCPKLFFRGAMNAMAGDSKTRLPRVCPNSAIKLL